jgi:hypothetical protein
VAGECLHQGEFPGRQAHLSPAGRYFTCHKVEENSASANYTSWGGVPRTKPRPHPGQEFFERERFRQVVVGAKVECPDPVVYPPLRLG